MTSNDLFLETIKALGLRPRAFICFSVSGTPDETRSTSFLTYYLKVHCKLAYNKKKLTLFDLLH